MVKVFQMSTGHLRGQGGRIAALTCMDHVADGCREGISTKRVGAMSRLPFLPGGVD